MNTRKTLKQEVSELSTVVRRASDREMWTQMFCELANGYLSSGGWRGKNGKALDSREIIETSALHADLGMKELNNRYPL